MDLIHAFLDESGYKFLYPAMLDAHAAVCGEYYELGHPSSEYLIVMCKHSKWDICIGTDGGGVISVERDVRAAGSDPRHYIGPPMHQTIDMADPDSLDKFRELL